MIDEKTNSARRHAQPGRSSQRDLNQPPLPMWPMAPIYPANGEILAAEDEKATAGEGRERDNAVGQLARALRIAKCAYRAYLNDPRVGEEEPVEDWSTWYAEYLLGLR